MKKLFLSGILAFSFGASGLADMKIGVVDMGKAFDVYYKTKDNAVRIAKEEVKFKKEIEDFRTEYVQSSSEADSLAAAAKDTSLPVATRKDKDFALAQKVQDLKSLENDIRQMSGERKDEVQDDLRRSHKEILEQISKVVSDYASKEGYDLVFDTSVDSDQWMVSRLPFRTAKVFDLTEQIIKKLNASAPPLIAPADAGRRPQ